MEHRLKPRIGNGTFELRDGIPRSATAAMEKK